MGDREQIAVLLINLGCSLQEVPEKPDCFREALLLAQEIKSDELCSQALMNLGNCYVHSGEITQAEACTRSALTIARRLGSAERISTALFQMCIILRQEGHLSEAEACIQEAECLIKELGSRRFMCIVLHERGELALVNGHTEQAFQAFQEMSHLSPYDDSEVQALSLFGLARTYEQLGQREQALSFYKQSLDLIQQKKLVQHIERVQAWYTNLLSPAHHCICGKPLIQTHRGRTKQYCSNGCRQRAMRERNRAAVTKSSEELSNV
jgi:tetratricopeptide (TPR) repeat protein